MAAVIFLLGQAPSAWALCTPLLPATGASVTCTGANLAVTAPADNLSVSIAAGAVVSAAAGGLQASLTLTGNGANLTNAGDIGTLIGLPVTGVAIGNVNGNVVNVVNTSSGVIQGLTDLLPATLGSGIGFGVLVRNGIGGVSTITNAGTIDTNLPALPAGAGAAIGATGGGAVAIVNTGIIAGRVAVAANATAGQGQRITNAGTINGSVAMTGANNRFTAVSGSQVNAPVPVAALTLPGNGLALAAGGVVDGGTGGNNTLVLQNAVAGHGSGNVGTGTAAAGAYVDFQHLNVNSGTWTTQGALVSGDATLNGGIVAVDDTAALGSGPITANGGTLSAAAPAGIALTNAVTLGNAGLTVSGANDLILNGAITGAGTLIKQGGATLTLNAANTFSGGATLASGALVVGDARALGSGALAVTGDATLDNATPLTLTNAVDTNAALTMAGSGTLALNGVLGGTGRLIKQGNATLTLAAANTFAGGTTLAAGNLVVGADSSLGSGTLTVSGDASLDTGNNVRLGNAIDTVAALTICGSNDLALDGNISGNGSLIKMGAAALSLNGANTYSGGTTLNAGTLTIADGGALGSGELTASGAATLDALTDTTLGNAVHNDAGLTLAGSTNLTLNGAVSGAGDLTKNGAATLGLNGDNNFAGGVTLNAGVIKPGSDTALGTGALTVAGPAALGNDVAVQLPNPIELRSGLTLAGAAPLALNGAITGNGGLIKNGEAALALNGDNQFRGGATLNGGTVTLGSATALGAGPLTVNGTAKLALNGVDQTVSGLSGNGAIDLGGGATLTAGGPSSAFSGTLSGSGGLVKQGAGTLVLSGVNTYRGSTVIRGGTLQLGAAAGVGAAGAAGGAGAATGAGTGTGTGAGSGTGSGSDTGSGSGTGPGAGTGSGIGIGTGLGTTAASLAGNVMVGAGATLRGNGTIGGNVTGRGTVIPGVPIAGTSAGGGSGGGAPGLSTGTLQIAGGYTQSPSSMLVVSVTPTSATMLRVNGTAILRGGLSIVYGPGTYTGAMLQVLNASSVIGRFSRVTTTAANGAVDGAVLAQAPSYRPTGVDIPLLGTAAPVVVRPEQSSIYSAPGSAVVLSSQRATTRLLQRLARACTAAGADPAGATARPSRAASSDCMDGRGKAWVSTLGDRLSVGSRYGQPGFQTHQYGFVAGAEQTLHGAAAGVSVGYANESIGEDGTGSHANVDSLRASIYGVSFTGPLSMAATLGYAYDFLEAKRPFGNIGEASGTHGGHELNAGVQAGMPMTLPNGLAITPRAGVRYAYLHANSYQESGAVGQDLHVGTDNVRSMQPYVGIALEHNLGLSWRPMGVRFSIDYAREVLDATHALGISAADGTAYTASGVPISRDRLSAGVGIGFRPSPRLNIEAGYDMLINTGNLSGNAARLAFDYAF